MKNKYNSAIDFMYTKYKCIGNGNTRAGFLVKNKVIKVPLDLDGARENIYEFLTSRKKFLRTWNISVPLIKFEVHTKYTNKFGIPIIVSPLVSLEIRYAKTPAWVSYIDGAQIGYDDTGRLVCYDFGDFNNDLECKDIKRFNKINNTDLDVKLYASVY